MNIYLLKKMDVVEDASKWVRSPVKNLYHLQMLQLYHHSTRIPNLVKTVICIV